MRKRLIAFAAALVLTVGLCPAIAFAATADANDLQAGDTQLSVQASKDLGACTIKFTGKNFSNRSTDTWQLFYTPGKNVPVTPQFDLYYGKKKVAKSKYTVTYKLTWWDDKAGKDRYKTAKKLTASASPAADNSNMGSEYRIIVKAKKGSGFTGTYDQATAVVVDAYNIGFSGTTVSLAKAKAAWRYARMGMDDKYWVIPQASAKKTLNSLKVKNGKTTLPKSAYTVTYYKAKKNVVKDGIAPEKAKTGKKLSKMPTEAGSYIMIIKGKKPYYGTEHILFDIQDKMSNTTVAKIADQAYTGSAITPNLTVKYKGKTLKQGTDYTVEWKDNVEPGTATAVITGCNKVVTFEFDPEKAAAYQDGSASVFVEKDKQRFFTGSQTVTFKIV